MAVIDFNTKKTVNIWPGISGPIAHSDTHTFGHFTLEQGAELPEHSHINEQWTNILSGELEFTFEGKTTILTKGMAAYIPSNVPHSAKALSTCKVIDCFHPVRVDFKELEANQ